MKEIGQAVGWEALVQGVSVVLGPGVNIKRNPLCGVILSTSAKTRIWRESWQHLLSRGYKPGSGRKLEALCSEQSGNCPADQQLIIDARALREILSGRI